MCTLYLLNIPVRTYFKGQQAHVASGSHTGQQRSRRGEAFQASRSSREGLKATKCTRREVRTVKTWKAATKKQSKTNVKGEGQLLYCRGCKDLLHLRAGRLPPSAGAAQWNQGRWEEIKMPRDLRRYFSSKNKFGKANKGEHWGTVLRAGAHSILSGDWGKGQFTAGRKSDKGPAHGRRALKERTGRG